MMKNKLIALLTMLVVFMPLQAEEDVKMIVLANVRYFDSYQPLFTLKV